MTNAMPKLTYPEYLELEAGSDRRLEYVAGVVHAMAGGSPDHSFLGVAVCSELRRALKGRRCRVYGSDLKLRIDAVDRSTYADGVVVCGPGVPSSIDGNAFTNPTVIVEVLSPSTEASDRGDKWRHDHEFWQSFTSLREYVLVSPNEPRVEVFSRDGDTWQSRARTTGERFELPSQGIRIAVDDIYAGLEPDRG